MSTAKAARSNFNLLFVNIVCVLLFHFLGVILFKLAPPELLELAANPLLVLLHALEHGLVVLILAVLLVQLVLLLKSVLSFLGLYHS